MANLVNRQFSVSLDDDTLAEVEKVRFEHQFDNRSLAMNYLVRLGLEALKEHPELSDQAQKKATRVKKEEREAINEALRKVREGETR